MDMACMDMVKDCLHVCWLKIVCNKIMKILVKVMGMDMVMEYD
jgi:hypothetical protein